MLLSELEQLAKAELIKGDIDNAIVMVDKKIDTAGLKNLAKLLDKQELEIDIRGNTKQM